MGPLELLIIVLIVLLIVALAVIAVAAGRWLYLSWRRHERP